MSKKVTIAPVDITDEQWKKGRTAVFSCSFTIDGSPFYVDRHMIGKNTKPGPEDKVLTVLFDKANRSKQLVFPEGTLTSKGYDYFMSNPYIDHPENKTDPNKYPRLFAVVDYEKSIIDKSSVIKKTVKLLNMIVNFSEREKVDVCFFMGEDPKDKTDGELLVHLVDFEKGILLKGIQPDGRKNIDYFLSTYNGETEAQMETVIKKAIYFGVIEKKDIHYYIGNALVGSNIKDLIAYFNKNESIYNDFVVKQVRSQDLLPNESYPEVDEKVIEENINAELAGLKEKAKDLKIPGWALMKNVDGLKKVIAKKERELESEKKSDLKKKADLEKSNETDVLADQE